MVSRNTIIHRCPSFNRAHGHAHDKLARADRHRQEGCSLDRQTNPPYPRLTDNQLQTMDSFKNTVPNWSFSFGEQSHFQTPGYKNYTSAADCGQHATINTTGYSSYNQSLHPVYPHTAPGHPAATPLQMDPNHGIYPGNMHLFNPPPANADILAYGNPQTQAFHYSKIERNDAGQPTHLSHTDANVDVSGHAPGGTFRVHTPNTLGVIAQHGAQPATTLHTPQEFADYTEAKYGQNQGLYYYGKYS